MKFQSRQINTNMRLDEVQDYKYKAIHKKTVKFKPGTSIIVPYNKELYSERNNSVYVASNVLTIIGMYERRVFLKEKSRLILGGGILQEVGFGDNTTIIGKTGYQYGFTKHAFECGLIIIPTDDYRIPMLPYAGYRYQAKNGFLFRADMILIMIGVSFGYSF